MNSELVVSFRNKLDEIISGDENIKMAVDERDLQRIQTMDRYVKCFINWRRGDVDAAVKMAVDVLKWRKQKNINDITTETVNMELLKRGIVFVHGKALDGTRLVYFIGRHQTKDIKEDVQKILCLWLERLHQQENGKHITFLLDVSKTSMSNVDLGGIRFLLDCFTTYFPDMLERIVIIEMPWIMNAIWKVVKQWLTEQQRQKTAFVYFKDLNQFIDPNNILTHMGGQDQWKYEYPLPRDSIPSLTSLQNFDPKDETESLQDITDVDEVAEESDVQPKVANCTDRVSNPSQKPEDVTRKPLTMSISNHSNTTTDILPLNSENGKSSSTPVPLSLMPGVNLNSLLHMSPISEVVFDQDRRDPKTEKYQSSIKLTNLKDSEVVAFKIKTNFPGRYHVKPSYGCVEPGQTLEIKINLNEGYEQELQKDRFLLLYQVKNDEVDLVEFWKTHLDKEKRHEYRIRVKFNPSTENFDKDVKSNLTVKSQNVPKLTHSAVTDNEIQQVRKDILELKNEIYQIQNNTAGLHSRLQYSFVLNCIVLILLLYVVYHFSSLVPVTQFDNPSQQS